QVIIMRCAVVLIFSWLGLSSADTLTASFGRLESPNYPLTYPDNVNDSWVITTSRPGYRIRLHFTDFDVEDSYEVEGGACVYDYLQIDNGARYCGTLGRHRHAPNHAIYSRGNSMEIRFVSDYSNEDPIPKGFAAHYRHDDINECEDLLAATNSEDWDEAVYCNHECHNVPGSYYCSCRIGYHLHANQHTCVGDCPNTVLRANTGILTSHDYPQPYSKLSSCTRTIQSQPGRTLEIRFDPQFSIEDHFEYGCVYDWVEVCVFNIYEFCGHSVPHNGTWINLSSKQVDVTFHSDLTLEMTGYKMYYRTNVMKCLTRVVDPLNGRLVSLKTDNFEYSDRINITCNVGYRLVHGDDHIVCGEDGQWTNTLPRCQIKTCPFPHQFFNISHTAQNGMDTSNISLTYGSVIRIQCVTWYVPTSGALNWTCGADETWQRSSRLIQANNIGNLPTCRPVCGIKSNNTFVWENLIRGHISGGTSSRTGEWPWMAFIDLSRNLSLLSLLDLRGLMSTSFCGGSLVGEQHVVTAAHCMGAIIPEDLRVYLGVTNRSNEHNPHQQVTILVNNHPTYLTNNARFGVQNFDHDIAVLRLDRPVTITDYVRPICVPRSQRHKTLPERGYHSQETDRVQYMKRGVVTGWGKDASGNSAIILQKVRVPFVPRPTCVRLFSEQAGELGIAGLSVTNNMICAGYANKNRDSCYGDSGGPLTFRDLVTNQWYLNGIVSFGTNEGCDQTNVLGVYTDVGKYTEFLDNMIA
uniref:Granzyme M n=1 Tax=Ciona savignyi TaxID=51511 RepID=H2YNK9_CIOSA